MFDNNCCRLVVAAEDLTSTAALQHCSTGPVEPSGVATAVHYPVTQLSRFEYISHLISYSFDVLVISKLR